MLHALSAHLLGCGLRRKLPALKETRLMVYRGQVRNGQIVLEGDASLPEGAQVEVTVLGGNSSLPDKPEPPTLYERLKPFAGAAVGLPADMAENHDRYLHGREKKS